MSIIYKTDDTRIIIFGKNNKSKILLTMKKSNIFITFHTTLFKTNAHIFLYDDDYECIDTIFGEICIKNSPFVTYDVDNYSQILNELIQLNFNNIDYFVSLLSSFDEMIIDLIFDNDSTQNTKLYVLIYYKNNIFIEKFDRYDDAYIEKLFDKYKKESIDISDHIDYDVELTDEIKLY